MSSKQTEFDFGPERTVADLYTKPTVEYFKRAFEYEPVRAEVEKREEVFQTVEQLREVELLPPAKVRNLILGKKNEPILSTDSAERKATPLYSGCLMYFPLALAAVARHSQRGNSKHNPGQPLHWAREKSTDQMDCILRHAVDVDHYNDELDEYEEACALAWRALAKLQLLEEKRLGK